MEVEPPQIFRSSHFTRSPTNCDVSTRNNLCNLAPTLMNMPDPPLSGINFFESIAKDSLP